MDNYSKSLTSQWFKSLQLDICKEFEKIEAEYLLNHQKFSNPIFINSDSPVKFQFKKWQRSEEEKESAIRGGYSLEGVVGEAYTKETEGATPIQRFYNPQSGKHLLTKDKKEIETLANLGYMPENIAFYTPSQKNIQNYMDAVGKLNVLK